MGYLYVENYRGFKNEFIPIFKVNFLLGENSTGKSSILGLINLFSSFHFWLEQEFNTDEYQLGNYKDIVSINSTDHGFFRVGYMDFNRETPLAFLLEFKEKDGIPSVSRYSYLIKNNAVQVLFEGQKIRYKIIKLKAMAKEAFLTVFKSWDKSNLKTSILKNLKGYPKISLKTPHIPLLSHLIDEQTNVGDGRGGFVFGSPLPGFGEELAWIAPIRSKPKRTYDQHKFSFSPEGDHAPYLIRKYLGGKTLSAKGRKFIKFVSKFGKNSGLISELKIEKFGNDSGAPFELDIMLEKGKPLNISSVGYGVSQCLPILVEIFERHTNSWFAIQQPEVHLHPRAQAALGEVFYNLATEENKHFIVETHSDFIIDRFRIRVHKGRKKVESQVLFFQRKGGFNKAVSIPIEQNGMYSESQPQAFRNFFIKEELSLLGIR